MIEEIAHWQFAWPWLFALLPLPLLAARLLPPAARASESALRVPLGNDLQTLAGVRVLAPRTRLRLLPLLGWALLCVAAARPQVLGAVVQPPSTGRDLLLAVDLSGSMAERDMRLGMHLVDRLTAVKAVLGDFLERRVGDRVGLLLFGQKAYAVTPLTPDRDSVRQQLDDSAVGIAGQETAIGDALALAVKRLAERTGIAAEQGERVVILLTDGVNNAGMLTPDKASKLAHEAKVRVHTIGFGGEDPGDSFMGMRLGGRSQIDERTLQAIAQETGGRYFRARDTQELAGIYAELDRIEPAARQGEVQRPREERYPIPLLGALLLALLAAVPWPRAGALRA